MWAPEQAGGQAAGIFWIRNRIRAPTFLPDHGSDLCFICFFLPAHMERCYLVSIILLSERPHTVRLPRCCRVGFRLPFFMRSAVSPAGLSRCYLILLSERPHTVRLTFRHCADCFSLSVCLYDLPAGMATGLAFFYFSSGIGPQR